MDADVAWARHIELAVSVVGDDPLYRDVAAVVACMIELLTGEPLTRDAVPSVAEPVRAARPDCPAVLAEAFARALAPTASSRFASADELARVLLDPNVLISSSDAGAHVNMMCSSGDTTLLLTRHVRDRGDLTLERAVHELTGRQATTFGFARRGTIAEGNVADLAVFALDELHYDTDVFTDDIPGGGSRLRRPEGGYRATIVGGVVVQQHGELTGALPGRVLASTD